MYDKSIDEVLKLLETSIHGLTEEEVKRRLSKYGLNTIKLEEETLLRIFIRQFSSPLILILIVASLIALYFGEIKDFFFIIGIVIINGAIGFYQEYKAKTKIKELLKLTIPKVEVIRKGVVKVISAEELTVGDIVIVREGDVIPADMRFIDTNNLLVDESLLTGESIPVEKDAEVILPPETPMYERKNIGFSGTIVSRGIGKGVVYAIGIDTEMGKIYSKVQIKERETPLKRAISKFSKKLIFTIISLLSFIFILGILQGRDIEKLIMLIIAQLVSAVPEGLPIAVTVALVVGAVILYKKKVLIRQLYAVEGLGSATFICSDKTGTITENRLKVKEIFSLEKDKDNLVLALCNDSDIERGDPLEIAMLEYLEDNGEDYIDLRRKFPRVWLYPFDTKLKFMASINRVGDRDFLFVKGAFESLEKLSNNTEDLNLLRNIHDTMAESGLRVLAYGYTQIDGIPENILEVRIKIIGLIGFLDPPKESAVEAVKLAKQAGIKVMMLTGDNIKTAMAVAKAVGIHEEGKIALQGFELNNYSDDELKDILKNVSVIARVTPEDKYRVVRILQKSGEEVVMMGDGVNDMPAVKAADLGIAVNEGTEATKSVAKMVLLERDLMVIVDAIRVGRRISHNLRKVILYLVSTSIGEIILLSLAFLLKLPQPIYATQILWINLITDGIQDKPLALSREERWLLNLKPQVFSRWFLDKFQLFRIISFASFMAVVNISIFVYLLNSGFTVEKAVTIVFNSVVFSQWAHGFQAIREEPFFYKPIENFKINPYIFFIILFVGFPIQFFGVYFLSDFIHTVPLEFEDCIYPIFVFFLCFLFLEIRKWIEFRFVKKLYYNINQ